MFTMQNLFIHGPWWLVRNLLKIASYVLLGAIAVTIIGFTLYAENPKGTMQQITIDESGNTQRKHLNIDWPEGVYSLSHLALPISADDPLYGRKEAPPSPGIKLGDLTLHGEKGALEISASYLQRQRWNPFHSYTQERALRFMGLE